jgi:hypothetical protein
MSVIEPVAGEGFVYTITKCLVANPAVRWRNTYEAFYDGDDPPVASWIMDLATALLEFEKIIHLTGVQFVQTTISTYAQDSKPYDPESFITIPHPADTVGTRTIGAAQPLDLTAAFYVRRQVPTGRQGKLFYRGVLGENDVEAPAGAMRLSNVANMQTLVDDALDNSNLSNYFYPAAEGRLMLSMTSTPTPGVTIHRQIMAFLAAGATRVSNDHRWYDVSAPTQAPA